MSHATRASLLACNQESLLRLPEIQSQNQWSSEVISQQGVLRGCFPQLVQSPHDSPAINFKNGGAYAAFPPWKAQPGESITRWGVGYFEEWKPPPPPPPPTPSIPHIRPWLLWVQFPWQHRCQRASITRPLVCDFRLPPPPDIHWHTLCLTCRCTATNCKCTVWTEVANKATEAALRNTSANNIVDNGYQRSSCIQVAVGGFWHFSTASGKTLAVLTW